MLKFLLKSLDKFVLLIILSVLLASFFSIEGVYKDILQMIANFGIMLLFFLHGAKLSYSAIVQGIKNFKLHLLVVFFTFVFFPVLGLLLKFLPETILKPEILTGFLFLCFLPSTVQSSVIFTSSSGGNVSAAICSASLSSILGVFLSPFLVSFFISVKSEDFQIDFLTSFVDIFLKLMLPFILGHLFRPLLKHFIEENKKMIKFIDQSAIILMVYLTFSKAVKDGIWSLLSFGDFVIIFLLCTLLLFVVMFFSRKLSRKLGFSLPDEIAILFCGSKKSMVNGVPMATILFPESILGVILIPLLVFHQLQLLASAVLSSIYKKKSSMS